MLFQISCVWIISDKTKLKLFIGEEEDELFRRVSIWLIMKDKTVDREFRIFLSAISNIGREFRVLTLESKCVIFSDMDVRK